MGLTSRLRPAAAAGNRGRVGNWRKMRRPESLFSVDRLDYTRVCSPVRATTVLKPIPWTAKWFLSVGPRRASAWKVQTMKQTGADCGRIVGATDRALDAADFSTAIWASMKSCVYRCVTWRSFLHCATA